MVGGIVQFASGRHIKDVIQEEIARPLGIAGQMYVGIPDGVEERLATLTNQRKPGEPVSARPARFQIPEDHDFFKAMPPDSEVNYNDMRVRKACLPSANGHFTAYALAKMYGAHANGGEVEGVRLVSPERVPQMQRIYVREPDRVIFMPMRKGIGFFMGGKTNGMHGATGPRETAFGHPGAGGSIAFADPEIGLSIAVTINQMATTLTAEGPVFQICELIRNALGVNS